MNSTTYLELRPAEVWQSNAEASATFTTVGSRTSQRLQRTWRQRLTTIATVVLLQAAIAVALVKGGAVHVMKLPESITVVTLPHEELVIKAPPPTMPEIRTPIVPVEPITIEVQSETAITLPQQQKPQSVTPQVQTGGTSAVLNYQQVVLRQIDAAKRYPAMARKQQRQGVALVQFTMDRGGRVLDASLAKSSRAPMLDEEAVAAVKRASPFPAAPSELAGDPINLMVAVEFELH
jgi:TonB family protein